MHGDIDRGDTAATLDEIAAELGLTRERTRQIEAKALNRLRRELERKGFTAEVVREHLEWLTRPAPPGVAPW